MNATICISKNMKKYSLQMMHLNLPIIKRYCNSSITSYLSIYLSFSFVIYLYIYIYIYIYIFVWEGRERKKNIDRLIDISIS